MAKISFNFGANKKPRKAKKAKSGKGKTGGSGGSKSNAWRAYVSSSAPHSRLTREFVMRFAVRPVRFGRKPANVEGDEVDGLPAPQGVKLLARLANGIAEAKAVLEQLPAPGESLHALVSSRMDLADIIGIILAQIGPCERMRIATLGYHRRNLKTLLAWLDSGAVASLSLVASIFFRSHNQQLWEETLEEFRSRQQRAACCNCHAKVVTMQFVMGERLSIEGSMNLAGNGSVLEQFALIHDAGIHDFHSRWIDGLLDTHEGKNDEPP